MDRAEIVNFIDGHFAKITEINRTKGHDYAGDEDALANFKEQAVELGLTPYQVWGVFTGKHVKAVNTFVREGDVKSEPIEGRIHDVILYHFLLLALIEDEKRKDQKISTGLVGELQEFDALEVKRRSQLPEGARRAEDQLLNKPLRSGMSHITPDHDPHSPEFGRN